MSSNIEKSLLFRFPKRKRHAIHVELHEEASGLVRRQSEQWENVHKSTVILLGMVRQSRASMLRISYFE